MDNGINALLGKFKRYLRGLWHRRWMIAAITWPLAIVLGVVISILPERYEAGARIYVDTQTVLKPLMAGLAYQPDIEQQVRMLARTVITRPNIEHLVDSPELGLASADPKIREKQVSRLLTQIKFAATGSGNYYEIKYRDTNPDLARRLVEATLGLFVDESSGSKKRDSAEASRFIDEQIRSYEQKLVDSENRLKDFKIKNFGVTGVSDQDYFGRMSALSDEVNKLRRDLRAAEQSRDAYRRELASEVPLLPAEAPAIGAPAVVSEVDARLEAQKKLLDDMLRRYTDEHPDVMSARRVIQQLEAQKRVEAESRARAGGDKDRPVAATSPIYQKIRISLAETEAQIASLRSQLSAQQSRLDEVRAMAGRVPQVEAELAQLNRDYDIIRKNYDALVGRRESASLGVKLDESSHLAEFRIVEPPRVSPSPVFPARLHLALAAVALTLVLGLAVPILADKLHPTFSDAASLQLATKRPVLGMVSMARSELQGLAARADIIRLTVAMGSLLMLQMAWLAWIVARPIL